MSRISRAVRNLVVMRLSDAATGFNPFLAASMADAGITAPTGFRLPLAFTQPSKNFFQADVDPADFDSSTLVTYPFLTLFSTDEETTNRQKFQLFSGDVHIAMRAYLSWVSGVVLPDFETIADCFSEAMIATFNAPSVAAWGTGPVVYNGDIACKRSPIVRAGENWRQILSFTLSAEVHTT